MDYDRYDANITGELGRCSDVMSPEEEKEENEEEEAKEKKEQDGEEERAIA